MLPADMDVLTRAAERLEQLLAADARPPEIVANRLYSPRDAARLLGIESARGARTLSDIADLPYVAVGPNGGLRAYHGADLLQFIERRKVRIS